MNGSKPLSNSPLMLTIASVLLIISIAMRCCSSQPTPSIVREVKVHDTTVVTVKEYEPQSRDSVRTVLKHDTIIKVLCDSNRNGFTGKLLAQSDTQKLSDNGLLVMKFYDKQEPFAYWHKPSPDTTTTRVRTETITTTVETKKNPIVALTLGWSPIGYGANGLALDVRSFSLTAGVVLWTY